MYCCRVICKQRKLGLLSCVVTIFGAWACTCHRLAVFQAFVLPAPLHDVLEGSKEAAAPLDWAALEAGTSLLEAKLQDCR